MYKWNVDVCGRNLVAVEKQYIKYSECMSVALVIHHVKCMLHIVICGQSSIPCLSLLSCNQHDFRKKGF